MTTHTGHRESARETRWNAVLIAVLAAAGLLTTIYGAATITRLIVGWLAPPY
jgi:hypothetical protein